MKPQRFPVVALSVALLAASLGSANAATTVEWPTRWQVNGNGVTGVLEFSIGEDGSLIGRLMDGYVEGYVSGRHLFIRRTAGVRMEVWEGWLGKPRPGELILESTLIIAGTISVDEAGTTVVYPWFGRPEAAPVPISSVAPPSSTPPSAAPPVTPAPPLLPAAEPEAEIAAEPEPEPRPITVVETPPAPAPTAGGPLSGTWKTTTGGSASISQDGKTLTVTLADGSLHSGRMTGASKLVVGLRKGCCNGELEGPNVIVWSDGSRWQRAD